MRWGPKQDKKEKTKGSHRLRTNKKIQHTKLNLKIACCQDNLAFTSGFSLFLQGSLHRYGFSLYFLEFLGTGQDSHCIFQGFARFSLHFPGSVVGFGLIALYFPGILAQCDFCISDSPMFSSISAFQSRNGVQKGQEFGTRSLKHYKNRHFRKYYKT